MKIVHYTPGATRQRLSKAQKLKSVFLQLDRCKWTLSDFLHAVFTLHDDAGNPIVREPQHEQIIIAAVNGTTKPQLAEIVELMYLNATRTGYRANDRSAPSSVAYTAGKHWEDFEHAHPALNTWAVELVISLVRREGEEMIKEERGLHVPAESLATSMQKKAKLPTPTAQAIVADTQSIAGEKTRRARITAKNLDERAAAVVTWEKLSEFSFSGLERKFKRHAPIMWNLLAFYATPDRNVEGGVIVVRKYRPQNVIVTAHLADLTFCRSYRANLPALARGLWLYASKGHQSLFRVESRLAQSVAYSTTRVALGSMSEGLKYYLRNVIRNDPSRWFDAVGDNVQTYLKQRDHRLGRENRMITGFAGCAIEVIGFDPAALNLGALLERQARMDRKKLTADMILDDIDYDHLTNIAVGQFLRALIDFVPILSVYKKDLHEYYASNIRKREIPVRRTNIIPFATNSANEMTPQGIQEAVFDFLQTQMGLDEDTLRGRPFVFSGDGKTFDMLLKLRRVLAPHSGDFESMRCLVPLLELWHTKWTDLSRLTRGHWGLSHPNDSSTLARLAAAIGHPTPNDLRKVNFDETAHFIELVALAQFLRIWELQYKTTNLIAYFATLEATGHLPGFVELKVIARTLARRYAVLKSFEAVSHPVRKTRGSDSEDSEDEHLARLPRTHLESETEAPPDLSEIPLGTPWVIPSQKPDELTVHDPAEVKNTADSLEEDVDMDIELPSDDTDISAWSTMTENRPPPDQTLANTILLIRDLVWWREMCHAVAVGDTGRVWEILKVWIVTFSGSGNPYYAQYLLETYCNFKWEFPPALKNMILDNWLVNLHGEAGRFIERDLMQEHNNFLLEDLAQHKGAEFDDPFYRNILSMHVLQLLRLKDEMEERVSLKTRGKKHGAPGVINELTVMLHILRKSEVHLRRPGRSEGFVATDDFRNGIQALRSGKVRDFIIRTTTYSNILGDRIPDVTSSTDEDVDMTAMEDVDASEEYVPQRDHRTQPPGLMDFTDGELWIQESE